MIRIVLAGFFLLLTFSLQAQQAGCGTVPTQAQVKLMKQMPGNYNDISLFKAEHRLVKLPVRFHIVTRSDGSGGIAYDSLLAELGRINAKYINSGMEFFHCGTPEYINDDSLYDFNPDKDDISLIEASLDENTIDIFFFNSLASGSTALCGYTFFPGGPDYVMMSNACSTNGSTLSHELGHYFTLYHTHGTTNFGTTDELVDGSNCTTAGDEICDTPADPNLYQKVDSTCSWTGNDVDANMQKYQPMTNNIMSYSRKSCVNEFTAMQYARIREGYEFFRQYLCCSKPVARLKVSRSWKIITFSDSSDFAVNVTWDFGDGNSDPGWSGVYTYASTGIYMVKLIAHNSCGTDTAYYEVNTVGVPDIPGAPSCRVFPNPSSGDVHLDISGASEVSVTDVTGRILLGREHTGGEIVLSRSFFPAAGIYFCRVRSAAGVTTVKFAIQ